MKRIVAVIALGCAAALTACGPDADAPAEPPVAAEGAGSAASAPPSSAPPAAPPRSAPMSVPAEPAAPGAPAFAVLYPGAVLEGPAVTASGAGGPGGLATYTTDADPDAVVAFHRAKAEAAGLTTSMAMNQGDARAYGAARADGGANLQVVAAPTDGGPTSVQISWSAGR